MKRTSDEAISRAVKKMRGDQTSKYEFKSKGNQEQFANQVKIEAVLDDATEALESGNLREVRNALEEGKAIVATRKKHLTLADMHGWDFVSEYKDIPIAEDDSDEKRIRKVLKAVETKREKKKAEKAKKSNIAKPSLSLRSNVLSNRLPHEFSSSPSFSTSSGCYLCGKPGHLWRTCYYNNRARSTLGAQNVGGSYTRQLVPLQQATIMPPSQQKPT